MAQDFTSAFIGVCPLAIARGKLGLLEKLYRTYKDIEILFIGYLYLRQCALKSGAALGVSVFGPMLQDLVYRYHVGVT